jgi:hypothetical protein
MKKPLLCLAAVLLFSGLARAERSYAVAPYALHQQECGACHVAYPPGLLPAASWAHLMSGLKQHFGADASLDADSATAISSWLQAHAGTGRRVAQEPAQDRISKSSWFVRQHDEVSASTWKRASIGSPSNCAACHAEAAKGNFNEHQVRIPQ